jgi:hypothetical protein
LTSMVDYTITTFLKLSEQRRWFLKSYKVMLTD